MGLADFSAHDLRFVYALSQYLGLSWYPGFTGNKSALEAYLLGNESAIISAHAGDNSRPAFTMIRTQSAVCLLIEGIGNSTQARALADAWQSPTDHNNKFTSNGFILSQATSIQALVNLTQYVGRKLVLFGHSFGGAIAHVLAAKMSDIGWTGGIASISLGAPKPAQAGLFAYLGNTEYERIFLSTDPVPYCPPDSRSAVLMHSLLSTGESTNVDQFVQPGNGLQIRPDGTVTVESNPTTLLSTQSFSLLGWLAGFTGNQGVGHSLGQYVNALQRAQPTPQQRPEPWPTPRPSAEPATPRDHGTHRAQEAAQQNVFQEQAQQNAVPLVIPQAQRFVAVRSGRIWAVEWQGQVVAVGPSKARARVIARTGNRLLHSVQPSGWFSSTAFQTSLDQYLASAASEESGFSPVLADADPLEA